MEGGIECNACFFNHVNTPNDLAAIRIIISVGAAKFLVTVDRCVDFSSKGQVVFFFYFSGTYGETWRFLLASM